MKRSKAISFSSFTFGISGLLLSGCGDDGIETYVANSVEDCVSNTGLDFEQCSIAYQDAMEQAEQTAPQFFSEQDCEFEFGIGNCYENDNGNSFFPLMAGYLIADKLFDKKKKRYKGYYTPVYAYKKRGSRHYNNYMFANGSSLGSMSKNSYKLSSQTLNQKPNSEKPFLGVGLVKLRDKKKQSLAKKPKAHQDAVGAVNPSLSNNARSSLCSDST